MAMYRSYEEEKKKIILLSTKELPTELKLGGLFLKYFGLKLTEQYRDETCQKAMLPIKFKLVCFRRIFSF